MKKNIQLQAVLFLGIVLFLINGCKKDGATGPQGPSGKNGNANVSSATYTMSTWSYVSPYYYLDLSVPELTASNIDSAMVMVYFGTIGSHWVALPYTQYNSPFNYYMGFTSSVGQVQVTWVYDTSTLPGIDPNAYYGTTVKCKVVIIPPAQRKANPHVHLNNYSEVKTAYGLKD